MRWWSSPATIPHTVAVPYVTATVAAEPRPCTAVIEKTAKRERERVKGGVIGKVRLSSSSFERENIVTCLKVTPFARENCTKIE